MSEDPDVADIGAVLDDEPSRRILTETSMHTLSASELSDRCGVSGPTVYRRLERLRRCDLVEERTEPDPSGGHHRQVYAAKLDRVTVSLDDGELTVRVDRDEDMVDRFTRFVEGI